MLNKNKRSHCESFNKENNINIIEIEKFWSIEVVIKAK